VHSARTTLAAQLVPLPWPCTTLSAYPTAPQPCTSTPPTPASPAAVPVPHVPALAEWSAKDATKDTSSRTPPAHQDVSRVSTSRTVSASTAPRTVLTAQALTPVSNAN
jgi:hypothetical protein